MQEEVAITPTQAVIAMKKGASLLKFGRQGDPHFRTFKLSEDMKTLTWTSPKKKGNAASGIDCCS